MGYVDDAFLNLKGKLEITATESGLAVRRHHEIRDHVPCLLGSAGGFSDRELSARDEDETAQRCGHLSW